jgi:hypothetical protein
VKDFLLALAAWAALGCAEVPPDWEPSPLPRAADEPGCEPPRANGVGCGRLPMLELELRATTALLRREYLLEECGVRLGSNCRLQMKLSFTDGVVTDLALNTGADPRAGCLRWRLAGLKLLEAHETRALTFHLAAPVETRSSSRPRFKLPALVFSTSHRLVPANLPLKASPPFLFLRDFSNDERVLLCFQERPPLRDARILFAFDRSELTGLQLRSDPVLEACLRRAALGRGKLQNELQGEYEIELSSRGPD